MKVSTFQSRCMIFIVGLLVQFPAHTFVTYMMHIPDTGLMKLVRVRKEILVACFFVYSIYIVVTQHRVNGWYDRRSIYMLVGLVLFGITSMIAVFGVHHQPLFAYILSIKYTITPLVICISTYIYLTYTSYQSGRSSFLSLPSTQFWESIYTVLWWVSWLGLGWYMWLHTFPNTMDWLGYAQPYDALGWHTDSAPPSLYLTQGDIGAIRNQAMFHGPLGLAFYLLALWPLFVALTRRKYDEIKAIKHTREDILFVVLPVGIYILVLLSSVSRAAIGAWVIVVICMALRAIKSYRWKYRMYIVGLGILGFAGISSIGLYMLNQHGGLYAVCTDLVNTPSGKEKISFGRDNSDAGHIKYLCQGIVLLTDNPVWGIGASKVGPASYHLGDEKDHFNTENQYLQIYLEYGLLGFLARCGLYILCFWPSLTAMHRSKTWPVWTVVGLGICGIVLHPLVDTATMYTLMVCIGRSLVSPDVKRK